MSKIVELCDVVVGNEEDLQKGLGIAGVDVRACALVPAQPHAAEAARAIVRALRACRGGTGVLTSTFGLLSTSTTHEYLGPGEYSGVGTSTLVVVSTPARRAAGMNCRPRSRLNR